MENIDVLRRRKEVILALVTVCIVLMCNSACQNDRRVEEPSGESVRNDTSFPGASDCITGGAVSDRAGNPALFDDCELLSNVEESFSDSASMNWSHALAIEEWDGVTVGSTPIVIEWSNISLYWPVFEG